MSFSVKVLWFLKKNKKNAFLAKRKHWYHRKKTFGRCRTAYRFASRINVSCGRQRVVYVTTRLYTCCTQINRAIASGSVRLFGVSNDTLAFSKHFPKQNGRAAAATIG